MKFHRFCSSAASEYTGERYGIFVAVWHLVRDRRLSEAEEAEYWLNRSWYESHLPIPPCYAAGNKERAITWFKQSALGDPMIGHLAFYRNLAAKHGLEISIDSTNDPCVIFYEDDYQVCSSRQNFTIFS